MLTVTSLADTTTAGSALTLREAIMVVDGTLGRALTAGEQASITGTLGKNDTIQFNLPAGPQTITLTGGALSLTKPVTIVGPGASSLTINENGTDRVFYVGSGFSQNLGLVASLSGLTINGGNQQYGAGIFNSGTLTLSNCTISNNTATNNGGGGIYNHGALTLTGCTFTGNSTVTGSDGSTDGGALQNISGGTATLTNCTFTGNTAPGTGSTAGQGGAIGNDGTITMTGCVFNGNSAGSDAGALYTDGTATMTFCAFTNNTSGADGGALHVTGACTITNCLIAGNYASSSGGGLEMSSVTGSVPNALLISNTTFYNNTATGTAGGLVNWEPGTTVINCTFTDNRVIYGAPGYGPPITYGGGIWSPYNITLQNCIIDGNFQGTGNTPNDFTGYVASNTAYNIFGATPYANGLTNGVSNNQLGVANTGLGTLANNGGPTQTVALLSGSPAIAAGNTAFVAAGATDQRGLPRIVSGTVDLGAYEVQGPPAPATTSFTLTGMPTALQAGTATTFTLTALTAAGSVATGYTGTVHFTSTDLQAVLPADYTFTTTDSGVHTFSVTLKSAGAQAITASDGADGISITQSGIAVTPAAASTLVLSGLPGAITAGTAATFTVTAQDAFGNTATGYTGTIRFASSDSQALLPSNYTFSTANNGTHSFSVTFKSTGSQTLTAADTVTTSISGSAGPITVNAPPTGPVLVVNSTADTTNPGKVLTLREAIEIVDGTLGRPLTAGEQAQITGTFGVAPAVIMFNLPAGPRIITLTGGALDITAPVSINGPGAANLTINGSGSDRDFIVGQIWSRNLGLVAALSGLTISGGNQQYGAGILNFGSLTLINATLANNFAGSSGGGGIYNVGALTLNTCTFTGNSVSAGPAAGGAVDNISSGTVTMTGCTFTGNDANGSGSTGSSAGAVANSGTMTITLSAFTNNNTAASDGGAIYNDGNLSVATTSFLNNTALADGGAIRSGGVLSISACTFAGNTASSVGGALDSSDSSLTIINTTFANNAAGSLGGAIIADSGSGASTLTNCTITANTVTADSGSTGAGLYANRPMTLHNTIVAANFSGPTNTPDDIAGTVDPASSFNLIGTGGSGGLVNGVNNNQVGVSNLGLAPLANYGGPTMTVAVLPGSPALAAGSTAFVTPGETDQRGVPRTLNGTVDIGAYEDPPATNTGGDHGRHHHHHDWSDGDTGNLQSLLAAIASYVHGNRDS